MKEVFKNYLEDSIKIDKNQMISIICLIIVISGMFGWIYEFIFYYFNFHMTKFYMQGGNFLPWINIYAIGSIMIVILTKKMKKNPLLIFLTAFISTGILEYFSGYFIYKLCNGLRLWDYNKEMWNFGNIDGFVCLRSVTFFGISALILIYIIIPFLIYVIDKVNIKKFKTICIIICSIFIFDELYNLVFARIIGTPRASDIYKSIGLEYVEFNEDNN